jgi:hypothetical protein
MSEKESEGNNMERKEVIHLMFDDRLFELLSKDLYKDSMSYLREMTQNSVDAIRKRQETEPDLKGEISWELDQDNRIITEIDNGCGMDYEFVKEDWKRVGKSFKIGDDIGMYGIGRLSLWQIAESIFIRTNDVEIHWNSISQYEITKKDQRIKGLILTVKFKPEHRFSLDSSCLKSYLEENTNLETITIKVNGEDIYKRSLGYAFKEQIEDELATVYFKEPKEYDESIEVFEKGLLVKSVFSSNISAMMDFGKTVKTLSRESLTIGDSKVQEICMKALKAILIRNMDDPELRKLYFNQLKKFSKSIAYYAYRYESKDLAERLPVNDRLLKEYKGFYYSKDCILVERAKEKNINVLVIESDEEEACCGLIGLKPLTDIKDKLSTKFFVKKTDNVKGKRILMGCATFMEYLTTLMKKYPQTIRNGAVIKTERLRMLEAKYKNSDNGLDSETMAEGSGDIKYTLGSLAFGEANNKFIVAWQSGGFTVLNLNNDLIQTLLETERLDLVQETLIHEFTHLLGFYGHDETFVMTYNTIFHEYLKDKAKSSVVFETNVQINAIGEKYQQASLKISSNAVKKLNLKKGQKIIILLEKEAESEEKPDANLGKTEETQDLRKI